MFLEAYREHVENTRERLNSLDAGSRGWWKIANSLLTKAGCTENIRALKRPDGSWDMDPEERANELAATFRAKAQLPPPITNAYTLLPEHPLSAQQIGFLRIPVRSVYKTLVI